MTVPLLVYHVLLPRLLLALCQDPLGLAASADAACQCHAAHCQLQQTAYAATAQAFAQQHQAAGY